MRRHPADLEEKHELRGGMTRAEGAEYSEREMAITASPGLFLPRGTLKPAAARPPAGRWGLTVPLGKNKRFACLEPRRMAIKGDVVVAH